MTHLHSHRAIPAPASSSWLALLPPCNSSSSSSNRQIVPRLPLCTVISHQHTQPLSAAATAATLARPVPVLAPTAPPPAAAAAAAVPAAAALNHTAFTAAEPDELSTTRARLYALYEFVSAHGRLPSVQDSHQGVAVGQWAEKCRQLQQQQGLEPQLASALQSIPGWTWELQVSTLSDGFKANLQQMAAYAQRYGEPPPQRSSRRSSSSSSSSSGTRSADAPSDAEREAAVAITKQVVEQRKRGVLTRQQMDAVAQAVPGWHWDSRIRSPPLEDTISRLTAFCQQHGRLPKADERLEDGFLIGEWCAARRSEYQRGQLEGDVAAALETQVPGWLWNRLDNFFDRNLEALAGFVAEHGRTPTQRETHGGVRVGAWCNKRRLQYKAGGMPADRVAALEAIPGWWWSCEQMPEET